MASIKKSANPSNLKWYWVNEIVVEDYRKIKIQAGWDVPE
ncbi:hypothetical protein IWQ51_006705 [Labrenzia sp. EL_142]|nr:hypothetical protein [Labrenzia sp. EL_142]